MRIGSGTEDRWKTFKDKISKIVRERESKAKHFTEIKQTFLYNNDPSKFHAYV